MNNHMKFKGLLNVLKAGVLVLFISSFIGSHAKSPEVTLQPQITLPVSNQNGNQNEIARLCRQQACCIYNGQFYSEGAIISLNNNMILHCSRNPNVTGAGAVTWSQLK
ncbi:DUF1496 domain-containing protein [Thorsellia kenyensis]|uniref:DUF1496 domain-containing protein n=1 Tax=Thorsellia kenyensis TaxID=1549888 RepID=A0ABV6C849_9GAMM